jgi:hypothetical protein
MIGQRHQLARLQSDFYRDCFYKALNWLIIEIVIMLILTACIIYHVVVHPAQHYYAAALGGQLMALVPSK